MRAEIESPPSSDSLDLRIPRRMIPLLESEWARYLGIYGGRGGAKSWFFADLLLARMVRNPSLSAVCVREVQRSLDQSVKRLLEQRIRDHRLEDYFDVTSTQIRSKRGVGRVFFVGLSDQTAESIKSFEGIDIGWLEEAQAISKSSLNLFRPTIRKPGAQIWAGWNPVNDTDPIDVLLRGTNRPENSIVVESNYYDNRWCPQSLLDEAKYDQQHDQEKYDHVWLGGYVKFSEARVFKNWRVEDFETPKNAALRFGLDWGFFPDPIAVVRGFFEGRKLYIDHEAYKVGCEIQDTPALILTIPEAETYTLNCASDRRDRVNDLIRRGLKAISVGRQQNSINDGVDFLRGFQIIVHPRCSHVISDLRLYSRKTDKRSGAVLSELEDKNNHCIDAIRYMVDEVRRLGAKKPEGDSSPPPTVSHWGRR